MQVAREEQALLGTVADVRSHIWGGYSGLSHRLGQFPPNSDILQKLQRTELICKESNMSEEYAGHTIYYVAVGEDKSMILVRRNGWFTDASRLSYPQCFAICSQTESPVQLFRYRGAVTSMRSQLWFPLQLYHWHRFVVKKTHIH